MLHISNLTIRPGLGLQGRPIRIRTNFFEVTSLPNANIHHYDITIIPEVPPRLNRIVFSQFEVLNNLGRIKPVYDGCKNVFTAIPLPFGDVATFEVTLPGSHIFRVIIKKAAVINMEDLHGFLEGESSISENTLTGIMALNILIRHNPSMMCTKVGRLFYTNQGSRSLYGGVEIWQGYFQSIKPTPKKMMIKVDSSATAFYESGSLIEMIVKILNKRSLEDLKRGISERDRIKLGRSLKGLKIRVIHRGSNCKFRITKLTSTPASSTNLVVDGNETDVVSHFQRAFNVHLQYPLLPCVVIQSDTFLPMELCDVVGGQRYLRKLNGRQMADIIKFTCQPPNSRANKIIQGLNILNYRQNENIERFGLKISNDMAIVRARILPTPKLQYHNSSRDASFVPKGSSWDMHDKKVVTGATLGSWACVVFGNERVCPVQVVQNFLRELINTCQSIGMNIPNKTPPILHSNSQGDVEKSLRQAWVMAGNMAKSQPQLIICILPNTGVSLYAEIKRVSDTIIGVVTQCIQSRHMLQVKKYYCPNVCLKINVKLGGMNSFIDPSQVPFITQRPTILMGASVAHGPGGLNYPSIAALCGSMDAKASRYATSTRVQAGKQEMISDLADMVKELLKTFYQTCGRKPERILFYRNGLSDSQFGQAFRNEVTAIKAACRSLDPMFNPTVTFVIVRKTHHIRFFPMDQRDSDSIGNCLPGTVVESTITHPFEFDFYLQSHTSSQGTSRPTHYHVLYDENEFTPDSLQTLSYNLCYVFARSTCAVSIVPPAYYAYLVCNRVRYHASCENWSDPDTLDGAASATYIEVKPELKRVMYFM